MSRQVYQRTAAGVTQPMPGGRSGFGPGQRQAQPDSNLVGPSERRAGPRALVYGVAGGLLGWSVIVSIAVGLLGR